MSASASRSIEMHGDACHDAWNGSGTDFGASQCFPMDLDAAAAAAARCVHSLNFVSLFSQRNYGHYNIV